jgi:hypothetical protein
LAICAQVVVMVDVLLGRAERARVAPRLAPQQTPDRVGPFVRPLHRRLHVFQEGPEFALDLQRAVGIQVAEVEARVAQQLEQRAAIRQPHPASRAHPSRADLFAVP